MPLDPFPHFILGANLPWVGYGTDIGGSAWYPSGSVNPRAAGLSCLRLQASSQWRAARRSFEPYRESGASVHAHRTLGALQDFLECVHESSHQPVTVGSAGTFGLDLVRPVGLGIYQVHWYERFGWPALEQPVADLDLHDRPAILGEFAGRSASVGKVLDTAKHSGYSGALVWSVLGGDDASAYPPDLVAWANENVPWR